MIDPAGAAERYSQPYKARSFEMRRDEHGQYRASLVLDEMAAWVRSMIDAVPRPRRGGPGS